MVTQKMCCTGYQIWNWTVNMQHHC